MLRAPVTLLHPIGLLVFTHGNAEVAAYDRKHLELDRDS
jgi:hypothetical protein